MRRREFITLLSSAAAAWPLVARAQQSMPRIGILMQGSPELSTISLDPFYQGLGELGYIEGQNIAIERRFGELDRLAELAAQLVGLKVDLIYAWSTPAARAAKQATNTIPIVAAIMADPVGDELVASLARPGGNVTGTTFFVALVAKRLQMLKETLPKFSRLAALWHTDAGYSERTMGAILKETELAADTLGLQVQLVQVLGPDDLDDAFSAMTRERADALIVSPSPMLFLERKRIVDLALKNQLPAVHTVREYVEAGGSYVLRSKLG
jgi:putative ABC transport system substrate-binding protein